LESIIPDELSGEIFDLTFKTNTPLEGFRDFVREQLGGNGAKGYWELLPGHAEDLYCSILETMAHASMLRVKIAKLAVLAACTF
jgi:hypothetical protein